MGNRVPLLLHACCAPCSIEPLLSLREEGFEPIICWTNPNIQPVSEHDLRFETLLTWAQRPEIDVQVLEGTCDRAAWESAVARYGMNREARCRACYALRLGEACRVAAEEGISYISTTLAVSPYQLFDTCSEVLVSAATAHGLTPVVRDFRSLYPEATRISRELGMYRQSYCGCRFSAAEAAIERAELRDVRRSARQVH